MHSIILVLVSSEGPFFLKWSQGRKMKLFLSKDQKVELVIQIFFRLIVLFSSQLVWSTSKHIGCGWTRCTNMKKDFIVCNYFPGGNFRGYNSYYLHVHIMQENPFLDTLNLIQSIILFFRRTTLRHCRRAMNSLKTKLRYLV